MENIEVLENRPPNDLDVVTVYWGYDRTFQANLAARFREFATPKLAKAAYGLDHYNFDASHNPPVDFGADAVSDFTFFAQPTRCVEGDAAN